MRRGKTNFWMVVLTLLGALLMVAGFPQEGSAQKKFWKIGTAGSGGTFYFLGSGIANVVTKYVEEVKLTPEATGGGIENLRRINRGALELALITPSDMMVVLNDRTGSPEKISVMGGAHDSVLHLVARKDTGYKTAKDFYHKGVKVGIGEPGSAVQTVNIVGLKVFGLTVKDVEAHPISQAACAEAIKDGVIKGYMGGSGVPLAGVSNVTQSIDAVILPFTEDEIKRFQVELPFFYGITIPAKTYRGQDKPVYTAGYPIMMMVRSDLDPDLVAKIIKAIYEHTDEIAQVHPAGKDLNINSVFKGVDYGYSLGFKFHPGAIKYLKEQKKWNPKYD
ncbi:MAG: TAXI family TRAP transporter solute-binding subunit [Deltaproteobacteria bacterium]|nr:TAXI family TRAP transporter solute-binding subunit [Deltaproteobacteria bacterium]